MRTHTTEHPAAHDTGHSHAVELHLPDAHRHGLEEHMGHTYIEFTVKNPSGTAQETMEGLVDTGATITIIPEEVARRLGLVQKEIGAFNTADGRKVLAPVYEAIVEIEGKSWRVPVAAGGNLKTAIGVVTLEVLGFKVNPVTGGLEPADFLV